MNVLWHIICFIFFIVLRYSFSLILYIILIIEMGHKSLYYQMCCVCIWRSRLLHTVKFISEWIDAANVYCGLSHTILWNIVPCLITNIQNKQLKIKSIPNLYYYMYSFLLCIVFCFQSLLLFFFFSVLVHELFGICRWWVNF